MVICCFPVNSMLMFHCFLYFVYVYQRVTYMFLSDCLIFWGCHPRLTRTKWWEIETSLGISGNVRRITSLRMPRNVLAWWLRKQCFAVDQHPLFQGGSTKKWTKLQNYMERILIFPCNSRYPAILRQIHIMVNDRCSRPLFQNRPDDFRFMDYDNPRFIQTIK